MPDIVDQLRDRAYAHKAPDPLLERAADEIVTLRAMLARERAAGAIVQAFEAGAMTPNEARQWER